MKLGFDGVERGIFEAIRKKIVELGYLPDITLFPNDPAGFEAAKVVIRNSGKKIIDVQGVGNPRARGELKNNAIFINRDDVTKGALGFVGTKSFDEVIVEGDKYHDIYYNASGTVNIEYQIQFMADDTKYDRLIQTIIFNALKTQSYIYGIDENGALMPTGFHIFYINTLDKSGNEFMERAMRYEVVDVIIEDRVFSHRQRAFTEIEILGPED